MIVFLILEKINKVIKHHKWVLCFICLILCTKKKSFLASPIWMSQYPFFCPIKKQKKKLLHQQLFEGYKQNFINTLITVKIYKITTSISYRFFMKNGQRTWNKLLNGFIRKIFFNWLIAFFHGIMLWFLHITVSAACLTY